jgi:hypothetical protein
MPTCRVYEYFLTHDKAGDEILTNSPQKQSFSPCKGTELIYNFSCSINSLNHCQCSFKKHGPCNMVVTQLYTALWPQGHEKFMNCGGIFVTPVCDLVAYIRIWYKSCLIKQKHTFLYFILPSTDTSFKTVPLFCGLIFSTALFIQDNVYKTCNKILSIMYFLPNYSKWPLLVQINTFHQHTRPFNVCNY